MINYENINKKIEQIKKEYSPDVYDYLLMDCDEDAKKLEKGDIVICLGIYNIVCRPKIMLSRKYLDLNKPVYVEITNININKNEITIVFDKDYFFLSYPEKLEIGIFKFYKVDTNSFRKAIPGTNKIDEVVETTFKLRS